VIRVVFLWLALLGPAFAVSAFAVSDPKELLPDPAQETRARELGQQLRCLVCQNNSVEESEADFARDLRRVIRDRVKAGDDDAQVIAWITNRYGEYVLLSPRFGGHTLLLWGSPVLALLVAGIALLIGRRHRTAVPAPLNENERAAIRKLLEP